MYYFEEPAIFVGVSELRTQLDKLLKGARRSKIYVGKRQKPVAVLIPLDQFEEMEKLYDRIEDQVLGYIAQERDKSKNDGEYLTLDEAEKKVGLR